MRQHILLAIILISIILKTNSANKPNIIHIVADDLGMNDLGYLNEGKTKSPYIDNLAKQGVQLDSYYTFPLCSPSRASIMSGRYQFNAGWYDMSNDFDKCLTNFTILPQLMKKENYSTHAIGKWDAGYILSNCTPTKLGFDTFLGYYTAALSDYWYHNVSLGGFFGTDLSNSTVDKIQGAKGVNGIYNARLFTQEAQRIIRQHNKENPLYMYVAFQNVHRAAANQPGDDGGLQAPCETVNQYENVVNDTYKAQSAVVTEIDYGVGNITEELKKQGLYNNTIIIFHSDNGGPLEHTCNWPLRGGKHTFWEGGVRVVAFITSPLLPQNISGSVWTGLSHSADWYYTIIEGILGSKVQNNTGPYYGDGYNIWDAIIQNKTSPRFEVVHQVQNKYFNANVSSIRIGDYKLIKGSPGNDVIQKWPEIGSKTIPFGHTGGKIEKGTDHCRAQKHGPKGKKQCQKYCLFNVVIDQSESNDLSGQKQYKNIIKNLTDRLQYHADRAPPVYHNKKEWQNVMHLTAQKMGETGFLEPLDSYEAEYIE